MFKYIRQHVFADTTAYIGKNGDITSDDDGTLFVHDGVTMGGLMVPRTVIADISSVQLLAIADDPVEIVPAPGLGKAISVLNLVSSAWKGSVGYGGGSNAGIYYGASTYLLTADPFSVITNGRSSFTVSNLSVPIDAATWKFDNAPIMLAASTNFTGGNGIATITLTYIVAPLANQGLGDF